MRCNVICATFVCEGTNFFAFFCPKLAAKHRTISDGGIRPTSNSHSGGNTNVGGERGGAIKNGNDKRKRDIDSGAGDRVPGSIINTTGRNIRFPSGLKETYCSHFVDTAKVCDFGAKCKHKHAVFPSGFDIDDHKTLLENQRFEVVGQGNTPSSSKFCKR